MCFDSVVFLAVFLLGLFRFVRYVLFNPNAELSSWIFSIVLFVLPIQYFYNSWRSRGGTSTPPDPAQPAKEKSDSSLRTDRIISWIYLLLFSVMLLSYVRLLAISGPSGTTVLDFILIVIGLFYIIRYIWSTRHSNST